MGHKKKTSDSRNLHKQAYDCLKKMQHFGDSKKDDISFFKMLNHFRNAFCLFWSKNDRCMFYYICIAQIFIICANNILLFKVSICKTSCFYILKQYIIFIYIYSIPRRNKTVIHYHISMLTKIRIKLHLT